MSTEPEKIHIKWSEREKVQLPHELLESLAIALVPEFQKYMRDKQRKEQEGQDKH